MERAQLIFTEESIVTSTTEVAYLKAKELAEKYNVLARQTALGVIEMAVIVYQAKKTGAVCFTEFCKVLKYKESDTMLCKLKKIGEKTSTLKKYVNVLPANWTTLYLLAKEDTMKVQEILENNLINPLSTAKEIKDLLGIKKSTKTKLNFKSVTTNTAEHQIVIKLSNLPTGATKTKIKSFLAELRQINAEIVCSQMLEEMLADHNE